MTFDMTKKYAYISKRLIEYKYQNKIDRKPKTVCNPWQR